MSKAGAARKFEDWSASFIVVIIPPTDRILGGEGVGGGQAPTFRTTIRVMPLRSALRPSINAKSDTTNQLTGSLQNGGSRRNDLLLIGGTCVRSQAAGRDCVTERPQ